MLIENNAEISKSPPSLNAAVWELGNKQKKVTAKNQRPQKPIMTADLLNFLSEKL